MSAAYTNPEQDRQSGARSGEGQQQEARPLPVATGLAGHILHLQRTVGNRAVGQILREYSARQARPNWPASAMAAPESGSAGATVLQRAPSSSDGGETSSSLAPAPTAIKPSYLVSALRGSPFPWEGEPDPKVPTIALLNRWLDYYNFHELHPLGDNRDGCDFNMSFAFNVDNVANIFVVDSRAAGFTYDAGVVRDAVVANLRPKQAVQAQVEADIINGRKPGPGETDEAKKDDDTSTQISIAWTFVPTNVHKNVKTGEVTADPPTLQVSGQFTLQLHKDGQRGFELSAAVQASFFADPGATAPRLQNFSAVGQAAWVTPFFTEFIQLQAVAQVLLGSNFAAPTGDQLSGPRAQAAAQAAVGPQVVFTIPGTGKHLQVVGQAQGSVSTAGGATTVDKSLGVGVQWVL